MKGIILKTTDSIEKTILNFLEKGLDKKLFDVILIPIKVPAGDSYAWVLVQDKSLLKNASPLPPVMPVQGARTLLSVTRRGQMNKKIVVVMRPCEVRAVIELSKLEQIGLENILLISIDCPGVLPLKDYLKDPDKGNDTFKKVIKEWGNESIREMCQICDKFVGPMFAPVQSDLHIGLEDESVILIPNNEKGKKVLNELGFTTEEPIDKWEAKAKNSVENRTKKRKEFQEKLRSEITGLHRGEGDRQAGLDNLISTFSKCISCHNCRSVCPICYCRQCYFDSEQMKLTSEDYMIRAESKGKLRFLPDSLLFHLGRMSHMSLSCVGCGACEDACPMSIKVAQIFSIVSDKAQEVFNYIPGRNIEEPLPLKTYKEDEFHNVET